MKPWTVTDGEKTVTLNKDLQIMTNYPFSKILFEAHISINLIDADHSQVLPFILSEQIIQTHITSNDFANEKSCYKILVAPDIF